MDENTNNNQPSDHRAPGGGNRAQRRRNQRNRNTANTSQARPQKSQANNSAGVTRNRDGSFDITLEAAKTLPIRLSDDDRVLMFTPPKMAAIFDILDADEDTISDVEELQGDVFKNLEVIDKMFELGLDEDDYDYLMNRIADYNDPLDYTHLSALFDHIFREMNQGNPTM